MYFRIFLLVYLSQFCKLSVGFEEHNKIPHIPTAQLTEEVRKSQRSKRDYEEKFWLDENTEETNTIDVEIDFDGDIPDFTPQGIRRAARTLKFNNDRSTTNSNKETSGEGTDVLLEKVLNDINRKLGRPSINETVVELNYDYEVEPIKPELLLTYYTVKPNKTEISASSVGGTTEETNLLGVNTNLTKSNNFSTTDKPNSVPIITESASLTMSLKKPTSKHPRAVTTYKPSVNNSKAYYDQKKKAKNSTSLNKMKITSNINTIRTNISKKATKKETKIGGPPRPIGNGRKPRKTIQRKIDKDRQKKLFKSFLNQLNILSQFSISPRNSTQDFQKFLNTVGHSLNSKFPPEKGRPLPGFQTSKNRYRTTTNRYRTKGLKDSYKGDNNLMLQNPEKYLKNIVQSYSGSKKKVDKLNRLIQSSLFDDMFMDLA